MGRHKQEVSIETEQKILEMRKQGFKTDAIIYETNTKKSMVHNVLKKHGLINNLNKKKLNITKTKETGVIFSDHNNKTNEGQTTETHGSDNYKASVNIALGGGRSSVLSRDDVMSIRQRHEDGEDIWNIVDDYRHVYKSGTNDVIRKIINREMFKSVE